MKHNLQSSQTQYVVETRIDQSPDKRALQLTAVTGRERVTVAQHNMQIRPHGGGCGGEQLRVQFAVETDLRF